MMFVIGFGISLFINTAKGETDSSEKFKKHHENVSPEDRLFYPVNMNEFEMQKAIHYMSHQKVKADIKEGVFLMTQDRIGMLIYIVQQNYDKYAASDIYLDILKRWYGGDFSQADKDHNEIWDMHDGTIGKATGLLNKKEEAEYL